jgi:threonine dehydratase
MTMPTLADVQAARDRLAGRIRRTPMMQAGPARRALAPGADVTFKLEHLQISGSFKARGALNKALSMPPEALARGLVTASGGNHGLGVAFAAWQAGVPATIFLPTNTPESKLAKLKAWGASVTLHGVDWFESNQAALALARAENLSYLHPFADPAVIAGQGTLALEILEDAPETGVIIAAIGGGGLISGVALAARALKPDIRILGVEPTGASSIHDSVKAGRLVTLDAVRTRVGTLAARATEPLNFEIIRNTVDDITLLTDEEIQAGAEWLWFEYGIAAELSGAAAAAGLLCGKVKIRPGERVCVLVCGAGDDGVKSR